MNVPPIFTPSAEDLRRQLAELGDGLQAQLVELSMRPDPDRAEILARNLDGARRVCMLYRERLVAEGTGAA